MLYCIIYIILSKAYPLSRLDTNLPSALFYNNIIVSQFKYAGDLVKSLARGGCDRPRWFCGECQANAHEFVDAPENEIPCCFQRMFDWVLSVSTD